MGDSGRSRGRISYPAASTPATMRRANERVLLERLARMRIASRADLAKAAGLSQPTAGKIIDRFLRLGLLREHQPGKGPRPPAGRARQRTGRPGRMIEFDGRTPRFLGVHLDVRETALAPLPVCPFAEVEWPVRFPTPDSPAEWRERLRQHKPRRLKGLWAVAVSAPGIVDERSGRVLFSPNLHWTERVNLIELLRSVWDLPVVLVQEIRALALGHLNAEPATEDFLLVDFGEGLGAAMVLNGRLYSGPLPLSGELGHTPVPGNPRPCGCGGTGCLETLVSRRGLLESMASSGGPAGSWAEFVAAVRRGAPPSWLLASMEAAGAVIAGALNVLGLRKAVVTGHLNDLPTAACETLAEAIRRGAMWARFGEILCELAPRRRGAGLIAACMDRLLPEISAKAKAGR